MSKGLRNSRKEDRRKIAERRAASSSKGLGYWAALDYLNKVKKG